MKKWLKRAGLLIGVLAILLGLFLSYSYFIEPRQFVVIYDAIAVPHWDGRLNGLRIVTIADIHTGSNFAPPERIRFVVEQANAQNPDVIVLLGDYVSESRFDRERMRTAPDGTDRTELKVPFESVAESLKGLRAKYGVYAVIGNHDWYHNEQKIHRMLEEISGINVLNNEIHEVELKFNLTARTEKGNLYLVELSYCGLIGMRNVPDDQAHAFLFAEAPRMLFPFARRVIADAVRDAGYPPLMLDPIDFQGIYMQQLQQRREQGIEPSEIYGKPTN